jgi:hypothetical protein
MTAFPSSMDAFATAIKKAKHGHRDWLVWKDLDGKFYAAKFSAEEMKRALLTTGTRRHWWLISANSALRSIGFWAMGITMLRNARHYGHYA